MFLSNLRVFWTSLVNSIQLWSQDNLFWEHKFYRISSDYCLRKYGMAVLLLVDWEGLHATFCLPDCHFIISLEKAHNFLKCYSKYAVYTDSQLLLSEYREVLWVQNSLYFAARFLHPCRNNSFSKQGIGAKQAQFQTFWSILLLPLCLETSQNCNILPL